MKTINMELIHNHVLCKCILIILSRFKKKTYLVTIFHLKQILKLHFIFVKWLKKHLAQVHI
jgi:hypothetical protein